MWGGDVCSRCAGDRVLARRMPSRTHLHDIKPKRACIAASNQIHFFLTRIFKVEGKWDVGGGSALTRHYQPVVVGWHEGSAGHGLHLRAHALA